MRFRKIQCATFGGFGCVEFGFGAHIVEIGLKIALHAHLFLDDTHFLMNARHLRETQIVDLVRRHVGRRIVRQPLGIIARAILKPPDTVVGSGDLFLRRHFGNQRLISRLY